MVSTFAVLQFYERHLKLRCFRRLKIYPQLKKAHNEGVANKREVAEVFHATTILRQHFALWKHNVLDAARALSRELDEEYGLCLMRRVTTSVLYICRRLHNLNVLFCQYRDEKEGAQLTAVFVHWRALHGKRRVETCEQQITSRICELTVRYAYNAIYERIQTIKRWKELCGDHIHKMQLNTLAHTFKELRERFLAVSEHRLEVEHAVEFHATYVAPMRARDVLLRALQMAEEAEQRRADEAAQAFRANFLQEERERREEMASAAMNYRPLDLDLGDLPEEETGELTEPTSTKESNLIRQNSGFLEYTAQEETGNQRPSYQRGEPQIEHSRDGESDNMLHWQEMHPSRTELLDNTEAKAPYVNQPSYGVFGGTQTVANEVNTSLTVREQPVIPEFACNANELDSSVIKAQEGVILDQIQKFKDLRAQIDALSEQLQQEKNKLEELEIKLDKTQHPFSCQLEIEQQRLVIAAKTDQIAEEKLEYDEIKCFLRAYKE